MRSSRILLAAMPPAPVMASGAFRPFPCPALPISTASSSPSLQCPHRSTSPSRQCAPNVTNDTFSTCTLNVGRKNPIPVHRGKGLSLKAGRPLHHWKEAMGWRNKGTDKHGKKLPYEGLDGAYKGRKDEPPQPDASGKETLSLHRTHSHTHIFKMP